VVNGVGSPPMCVRSNREHTQAPAEPVIGSLRWKKCVMAAIVLDKKKPNQEPHSKR